MKMRALLSLDIQTIWALSIVVVISVAGCGPNLGLVPVAGRVTFNGKSPPAECSLIFAPADASSKLRPGVAICDSSGFFRAGSYKQGDGLLPGRYRARIRCVDFAKADETTRPVDHVPPGFEPPLFEVPPDGTTLTFDVR